MHVEEAAQIKARVSKETDDYQPKQEENLERGPGDILDI